MKRLIYVLCATLGLSAATNAQSLSPTVISSGGASNQTNNVSVDWTVGEPAVRTITTPDQIITEGFHQAELIIVDVQTNNVTLSAAFHVIVAPNPVSSVLTVHIESSEDSKMLMNLTDLNGKNITAIQTMSNDTKDVDMSMLTQGLYLLTLRNASGELIKTYKISKIQ